MFKVIGGLVGLVVVAVSGFFAGGSLVAPEIVETVRVETVEVEDAAAVEQARFEGALGMCETLGGFPVDIEDGVFSVKLWTDRALGRNCCGDTLEIFLGYFSF